ncbi:MAG: hypothetical protein ACRCX8_10075, partial [Sarcina sp.]
LAYGYLPHIYDLIKTKKKGSNSLQYWVIMTFGIFCISINMFIQGIPLVQQITQIFNVGLAFISTVVLIYYIAKEKRTLANK